MTNKLSIGEKIRIRRKELNMTQEKLAESSGLSPNFISRLERTSAQNVSLKALESISHALNITVADLLNIDSQRDTEDNAHYVKLLINELNGLPKEQANRISQYFLGLLREIKGE